MPVMIKGINSGVIRHNKQFVSLALKTHNDDNSENLFLFSLPLLKDFLHILESRIEISGDENKPQQEKAAMAMLQQAPKLSEQELDAAQGALHVASMTATPGKHAVTVECVLQSGTRKAILINDDQTNMFIRAIILAIKNAGFQDILLTVSSMLDFIPLYDMDLLKYGKMEYDSYHPQPWKLSLFSRYLVVVYSYQQDKRHDAYCGAIVKTNAQSGSPEAEGLARRVARFSGRLKKIADRPCQVFCTDITPVSGELTQQQCLDSLHRLCLSAIQASTAK